MARIIEPISEATEDPVVAPLFAFLRANAPGIPNLFLTLGRAPHLFKCWSDFAWPMRAKSTSPRYIRELAIVRVLQLTNAENEFDYHAAMGMKAGLKQAQIDALQNWRESDLFTDREKAVLAVAEEIANGPAASEASMLALKKYFTESEVIEITLTACFYVLVSRFIFSLGIEHDDPAIVSAISASI
jgi:alkylhydroperoxidase family enzyme